MLQGTHEWHEFRRRHIGSSDAAVLMGTVKFRLPDGRKKTPYLLWKEKMGLETFDIDTVATRYGKEKEPEALASYESMTGDFFAPEVIECAKYPFVASSLDGINLSHTLAVEIKCPGETDHSVALTGMIPEHYYAQLQHHMMCLGDEHWEMDYFSYRKGEGVIVKVERDDRYIDEMVSRYKAFWKCVESGIAPEMSADDLVEQDDAWLEIAEELMAVKESIKRQQEREKSLEEILKEMSHGSDSFKGSIKYTQVTRKGSLDYSKIEALQGLDLEAYRKPSSTYWKLSKMKEE